MRVFPTRPTFHVALAGTAMVAVGVAMHRAVPVAFGSALLLTLAFGRALSFVVGTRIRKAGFEMGWARDDRMLTVARGEEAVVLFELRNVGRDAARAVNLRPIASSLLAVEVVPRDVDLPAGSTATLAMHVVGKRAGRWGIHGLAVELRGMPLGGDGPFEAPLVFTCPFGIEVEPWPLVAMLRSPRGGRSGRVAAAGRAARSRGEGDELRELRDHVVGDPFKRIAWRASARRGRLVVREMEREERDIVWLVVDASVDGWAGVPGSAPLDRAVDEAAAVAARHLSRGDRVGLVVYGARVRAWLPAEKGLAQAKLIAQALAGSASMLDVDRSELDEHGVAYRVAEHLRPLTRGDQWPRSASDLDKLAVAAEAMRARAPFAARVPYAPSPRERTLRHYMACFGMEGPPASGGERPASESELGRMLMKLTSERPRPSVVAVWAPAPGPDGLVARAVRSLRARRAEVRWTLLDPEASLEAREDDAVPRDAVAASVHEAVRIRVEADRVRGVAILRGMGVHAEARRTRRGAAPRANVGDEGPPVERRS